MKSFEELNLPQSLAKSVRVMGFTLPTPIQAQAIPVILSKRDMIGCAQTGSGKTAAFCIPLLIQLIKHPGKTGLILVPTRELAQQIEVVWKSLAQFTHDVKCTVLMGGASMYRQINELRCNPRVIIATPGRLLDHLNRGTVRLSKTEILILDEADRMLDMGFAPQLRHILRYLPIVRQTLLFSATWSSAMDQLSGRYLKDSVRINIGTKTQGPPKISQSVVETTPQKKNITLLDQLNKTQGSVLVFARTQVRTDRVADFLDSYGLEVGRIHGGRTQGQRNRALQGFRTGTPRILIATDIAARGIDVVDISHVINYDLPQTPEDYIHRIGRTARAGALGEAISFITSEDHGQWRQIVNFMKSRGSNAPELTLQRRPQPRR